MNDALDGTQAAQTSTATIAPTQPGRMTASRAALIGLGFLSLGLGMLGVFVPLLPTCPLVMLAAFLFAKSSPRFHAWLLNTKVYRTYVQPFKERGGIPKQSKIRMLALSLGILAISAALVRVWYAWLILGIVAACLTYGILVRVPTRE